MVKANDKMIIRVAKNKDNPYVMMNKTGLNDPRLSFKAKGILAYLLSKPDDWKVMVSELINSSTDGKTAVYSGLKELEENGYLKRVRVYRRDERTGKKVIDHWETVVYERPVEDDRTPDSIFIDEDAAALDNTASDLLPENQEIGGDLLPENLLPENLKEGKLKEGNEPLQINNDILNNDLTNNNNNNKGSKGAKKKWRAKKESPCSQGDKNVVVVPPLDTLKTRIEEMTGGRVQDNTLKKILAQPEGKEKIEHALKVYPAIYECITRHKPVENPVGLFFYIAENDVEIPVSSCGKGKRISFNDFEQHNYSLEELEALFEKF